MRRKSKSICIQEGLYQTLSTFSASDLRAIAELESLYSPEWEPLTTETRYWIRKMAESRRQMQKADQMENDIFTRNLPPGDFDERNALAHAFLADARGPNYLERVTVYRSQPERLFHKALKELNEARKRARIQQRAAGKVPPKLIPFYVPAEQKPKE